jgi:hypothetical protein
MSKPNEPKVELVLDAMNEVKQAMMVADTKVSAIITEFQQGKQAQKAGLAELKQQHVELEQQHVELEQQHAELKQQHAELKQQHEAALSSNKMLQLKITENEKQLEIANAHTQALDVAHKKTVDTLKQQIEQLKQQKQQSKESHKINKQKFREFQKFLDEAIEDASDNSSNASSQEQNPKINREDYDEFFCGVVNNPLIHGCMGGDDLETLWQLVQKWQDCNDFEAGDLQQCFKQLHERYPKEILKFTRDFNVDILTHAQLVVCVPESRIQSFVQDYFEKLPKDQKDFTHQAQQKMKAEIIPFFDKQYVSKVLLEDAIKKVKNRPVPIPSVLNSAHTEFHKMTGPTGNYIRVAWTGVPDQEDGPMQPGDHVCLRIPHYLVNNLKKNSDQPAQQNAGSFAQVVRLCRDGNSVVVNFLTSKKDMQVDPDMNEERLLLRNVGLLNKDFTIARCPFDATCKRWNPKITTQQGYKQHCTSNHSQKDAECDTWSLIGDQAASDAAPNAEANAEANAVIDLNSSDPEDEPNAEPDEPAAESDEPAAEPKAVPKDNNSAKRKRQNDSDHDSEDNDSDEEESLINDNDKKVIARLYAIDAKKKRQNDSDHDSEENESDEEDSEENESDEEDSEEKESDEEEFNEEESV